MGVKVTVASRSWAEGTVVLVGRGLSARLCVAPNGVLWPLGGTLYTSRTAHVIANGQALTTTYNQLKEPACLDPQTEHLRRLNEAVDRAVIAAYGWFEVDAECQPRRDAGGKPIPLRVPAYWTAEQQAFEDEVIDRLFVLNAEWAAEEAKLQARQAQKPWQKGKPKPSKRNGGQLELLKG